MAFSPFRQGNFAFRRYAGSLQMRISTVQELMRVPSLPEAHWVALACPIAVMNCDPVFLQLLDRDANGRIHARELSEGIAWLESMLADPGGCVPGIDVLTLSRLSACGAALRDAADLVLANLGASDREHISLAPVRETKGWLNTVSENGDGIITEFSLDDGLKPLFNEVRACRPPLTDRSGAPGIDRDGIAAFRDARAKAMAWLEERPALLRWGPGTQEQAALVRALKDRVDAYYLQCRLIASNPAAAAALRLLPEALAAAATDPAVLAKAVAAMPLAEHDPAGVLSWSKLLRGGSYEELRRLRDVVAIPVLGASARDGLREEDWGGLCAVAAPLWAWEARVSEHPLIAALGADRLRAISTAELDELDRRCVADKAVDDRLARVSELERLLLYQRWIFPLANNFTAMPHLYEQDQRALFEQGTLVMAGREFTLSILVPDRAAHAAVANKASMFILYCKVWGGTPARSFEVAVPVTSGTSGGLFVGKRGVFWSLDGHEYDAEVVQVVVQPVSLWEAIIHPFRRIGAFISSKIQAWSDSIDKKLDDQLDKLPAAGAHAAAPAAAAAAAAAQNSGMQGIMTMVTAGGVALGAIGLAIGSIVSALKGVVWWKIALGVAGLIVLFSLPSLMIAAYKILTRRLAVVLEGSGWAMNDQMRLNFSLGRLFTRRPPRPEGSYVDWTDQVARLMRMRGLQQSHAGAWTTATLVALALIAALVAAWLCGWCDAFTPQRMHRASATSASVAAPEPAPPTSGSATHPAIQ